MIFAGASGGGYVFPAFLPAYDAVMSTARVLEMLAHSERSLSDLAHGLPAEHARPSHVPCPWEAKGTTMRRLIEAAKGMRSDDLDGLKVFEDDGWVQMLPDPDEPVFHLYVEGDTHRGLRAAGGEVSRTARDIRRRRARRAANPQLELEDCGVAG